MELFGRELTTDEVIQFVRAEAPDARDLLGCHDCTILTAALTLADALEADRRAAPESKPLTCEGCAYKGKYEAEYEYGYPSPCTACKRRAADNYVRRPEGAPSEGSDKS